MNRVIYSFILLSVLVGCHRGVDDVALRRVSLYAKDGEFSSRTSFGYDETNDEYVTSWTDKDAMSVLIEQNGVAEKYEFVVQDVSTGRFECSEVIDDGDVTCDAYGIYPSSAVVMDNDKTAVVVIGSATQTQQDVKLNHIAAFDPLYGSCKDVSLDNITFAMKHTASVMQFNVKNDTGVAQTISSVKISAARPMVGTYRLDMPSGAITLTDGGSCDIVLNVEDVEVADGQSVALWIATAPFEMHAGEKLVFAVSTQDEDVVYRYEKTFAKDIIFPAAKIMHMNEDVIISEVTKVEALKRVDVDFTSADSYFDFPTGKDVVAGVVEYQLGGYPFKIECTKPYSCGNKKNMLRFYFNGGNASFPVTPNEDDFALIYLPVYDGYKLSNVNIVLDEKIKNKATFKVAVANRDKLSLAETQSNSPSNTNFSGDKLSAAELDKPCCIYIHFKDVDVDAENCNCNITSLSLIYELK